MNDRPVAKTLIALAALLVFEPEGAQLPASERPQEPQPSIATITAAWARRQAGLTTLRLTWHTDRTAAGFYAMVRAFNSPKPPRRRGAQPAKTAPSNSTPKDLSVTLRSQSALCLAHDRLAYTSDTEGVDKICGPDPQFRIPSHVQMILSGGNLRKYSDSRTSPKVADAKTAWIASRRAQGTFEMGLPEIKPLALALRPLTSTVAPSDLARYKILPIRGRIGADSCLILEPGGDERSGTIAPRASFWVDPARDYVIVRAVVENKGRCQRQTDIAYDRTPGGEWLPITWSVVLLGQKGGLDEQFRSTRDAVLLGGTLPPSIFELDRADSLLAESNRALADQPERPPRRATAGAHRRPGPSFLTVTNAVLAVLVTGGYVASKYKATLVKR